MPRPFPFAIGLGTDICHIVRIFNILDNPSGSAQLFLRRCLNPTERRLYRGWWIAAGELDACKVQNPPLSRSDREKKFWGLARFMSGRWAAKEAAIKAHTWRRLSMHDITIRSPVPKNGRSTAPIMTIKGMKDGEEEQIAKFSISHDDVYATAVCLAAEEIDSLSHNSLKTSAASAAEDDGTSFDKISTPEAKDI